MEAEDEERPLLHLEPYPQDIGSEYTSDGSVDINNHPAMKRNTGNWRACFLILGVELCECIAFYAIAKNLVTYLTTVLHESKITAARNVSAWVGACFFTPLIGAFLADTYLGRYWTTVVFLPVYVTGMVVLTISASISTLYYSGDVQHTVVYLGLYLVALGSGGVKPCISTFGADQFDSADPIEQAKKGSFFNWCYFLVNIGSLLSGTVLVWLQDNVGWGISFAIPTAFMIFGLALFVGGSRVYRFKKLRVSPFTSLCQVVVAALRNWHLQLPDDSSLLFELTGSPSVTEEIHKIQHTNQFRFLDKAAIMLASSDKTSMVPMYPWRLCTVTQVEELKIMLRMFPIWASFVIFFAVSGQLSSTFVEQGMVMDNRVGSFAIPPASLSIFGVFSVLICVLIYEAVLVPLARRITGKEKGFSPTQRIGIGLALSMLTMVYSAMLELKRLAVAQGSGLTDQNVPVPMSILWQAPAYFLHGAAEVFATIGVLEFSYDKAPVAMKSLFAALVQLTVASGFYLNSLFLSIVAVATVQDGAAGWIPNNLNEGHLDYFFWMMAILSLLNLAQFVHFSMRYREKTTT